MHISPWLIQRSSQIVAASAATHMFNFAMLQLICSIRRDAGAPGERLLFCQSQLTGDVGAAEMNFAFPAGNADFNFPRLFVADFNLRHISD
jgi:hypothetical protein